MTNDNSHHDNWGHTPRPTVFWTNGRSTLIRHCEGVFELLHDGVLVMPPGPFEKVNAYLWSEFYVMGDSDEQESTA